MRFSDRITFVVQPDSKYNPVTGEYDDVEPTEDKQSCNLSELGLERTNQLFGQVDKLITVARLQRPYAKKFDYVIIDGQKYNVKRQSNYRKGVLYLEGVGREH